MTRFLIPTLLAPFLLLASACASETRELPAEAKVFTVRGIFLGPRFEGLAMRVEHGAVPGLMEAMTMDFKLGEPDEIAGLQPGDRIEFEYVMLVDDSFARKVRKLPPPESQSPKIEFDLDGLNGEGLRGSGDGLVSLNYEFCIPDESSSVEEVKALDTTIQISRSPGRIHCRSDELLCIGETHRPNFRAVLEELSELPYVTRIVEARFE